MRHSKPVRLETAPTGPDKSGSKPRSEGVYLFLEFTIIRHPQCTTNPLNPAPDKSGCTTYQGDFEDFAQVEVIGKCLLIFRIHYSRRGGVRVRLAQK